MLWNLKTYSLSYERMGKQANNSINCQPKLYYKIINSSVKHTGKTNSNWRLIGSFLKEWRVVDLVLDILVTLSWMNMWGQKLISPWVHVEERHGDEHEQIIFLNTWK